LGNEDREQQFEADKQSDSEDDHDAEFAFDGSGRSLAGVHEGRLGRCGFHSSVHARRVAAEGSKDEGQRGLGFS
jgi:hypothetical protein